MNDLRAMLERHGFQFPDREIVHSHDEAVAAAGRLGFPVVLKGEATGLLHKTEAGAVRLHLKSADAVRAAYAEIIDNVRRHAPTVELDGVVVEEECSRGRELFIGIEQNPHLGLTLTVGLGGTLAELLGDIQVRTVPLTEKDALDMLRSLHGYPLLRGHRGGQEVDESMLVSLLLSAAALGEASADRLGSIDLNPIAVWRDQHRVLDATAERGGAATLRTNSSTNTRHLERFFTPSSVAVVGASATPGKIGYAIVESLLAGEYDGSIYPVNPKRHDILGLPCAPSLAELPEVPDTVVASVPLAAVPGLLDDCAAASIHNLIVVSGGGKEMGEDGRRIEEEIAARSRAHDVRVIGPNCIGVFDGTSRFDAFFQPHDRMLRPPTGPLAILSQSGTVAATLLEGAATPGVSRMVSYGNRADVDEADLIAFLGDDPTTQVIAMYIEGATDARRILDAIRAAAAAKPIVVFKAARSPSGASGALSHTGFFGGTYAAWEGPLRQAGAVLANSVEELLAAAKALAMQPRAAAAGYALVGNGAGPMVQALDLLSERGVQPARLVSTTEQRLRERFPSPFVIGNPLDLTGSATAEDYEAGIRALIEDPEVAVVMPWFVFQDAGLDESIVPRLACIRRETDKPVICGASGGPYTARMSAELERAGIPVFATVREWVAAATALPRLPSSTVS